MNQKEFPIESLPPPFSKGRNTPLFGKEGEGEIFRKLCLVNYGLLIKSQLGSDFLNIFRFRHKGEIPNWA